MLMIRCLYFLWLFILFRGRLRSIPRTMSTQHPDNARVPGWAAGEVIEGEAEVEEAYRAFSVLGIQEVMWDAEGKDVDTHVVRKLLSRYPDFFEERVLGRDVFITYRIPNPRVEGAERKVFSETMESIAVSCDVAQRFYGDDVSPIFEVILPLTTSYHELISVLRYYEKVIIGRGDIELLEGVRVRDLIGDACPKSIEVIPLVEDMESLLGIGRIAAGFWRVVKPPYMRVFIARSDPAMNYGMFSAVLLAKYALSELSKLSREIETPIYPIIGVGSLPFRGHMSPENYVNVIEEYRGVYTFTIQSAFKYDYPEEMVVGAVKAINNSKPGEAYELDHWEARSLEKIVRKYTARYQTIIEAMAGAINTVANYIPRRRARKLHIGLFGYAREAGRVRLPRAITFCGAMYTMGIPPELLGISALEELREEEWDLVEKVYRNLGRDLGAAAKYYNPEALELITKIFGVDRSIAREIQRDIEFLEKQLGIRVGGNSYSERKHSYFSTLFLLAHREGRVEEAKTHVLEMALIRRSIG